MNSERISRSVTDCVRSLVGYCASEGWAGYDPYDALNSRLFEDTFFFRSRAFKIGLTQLLKRCPLNFRPILRVPKSANPKGIALCASSLFRLSRAGIIAGSNGIARELVGKLMEMRSQGYVHWCWGYPFPWQSRGPYFPRWIPNIICTTAAGNALLDAYDFTGEQSYLRAAKSAADFLMESLLRTFENGETCLSYMPLAATRVHNANLLGAAYLCRVANAAGDSSYLNPALQAARFSVSRQLPDGSWEYGDSDTPPQRWKDNFHTGFNLCALDDITAYGKTAEFEAAMKLGFDYYFDHFFEDGVIPKYYHDRLYPIDIHAVAQSLITLLKFSRYNKEAQPRAFAVFEWARQNMRGSDGSFYFQKHRCFTNRTRYLRWSQAWMLRALSAFFENETADPAVHHKTRDEQCEGEAAVQTSLGRPIPAE